MAAFTAIAVDEILHRLFELLIARFLGVHHHANHTQPVSPFRVNEPAVDAVVGAGNGSLDSPSSGANVDGAEAFGVLFDKALALAIPEGDQFLRIFLNQGAPQRSGHIPKSFAHRLNPPAAKPDRLAHVIADRSPHESRPRLVKTAHRWLCNMNLSKRRRSEGIAVELDGKFALRSANMAAPDMA